MKTIYVLMIGISASILLISSSVIQRQDAAKTTPCACDDASRYERTETQGGGSRIAEAPACSMINAFEQSTGANRGGFISKRVLDNIFCGNNFNGISFYFAMDTLTDSKVIKLVIEGAHLSTTKAGLIGAGTDRYINETICPPTCSSTVFDRCK